MLSRFWRTKAFSRTSIPFFLGNKSLTCKFIGRLFPWMGLSGPAYTCGFHGLHNSGELLGIWPTLIDRAAVEPNVRVEIIES